MHCDRHKFECFLASGVVHSELRYEDGKLYRNREFGSRGRRIKSFGSRAGGPQKRGKYRSVCIFGKPVYEHRLIWLMHNGPIPKGMEVDHINGDGLDNRLENLRLVNASQQHQNERKPKGYKTPYKNVQQYGHGKVPRYRVIMRTPNGIYRKHGFTSAQSAHAHAINKREKLFGEYANHG